MKVFALYGSSRKHGNSELLANQVLEHVEHTKRYLTDFRIEPIIDKRHVPEGFTEIDDDYNRLIREMLESDVVVFVTPLYWYGMSGLMKNFVDRWSQSLRDENLSFKQKMQHIKPYVVIAGGDDPHRKAKPLVQQFELIFDYFGITLDGYVIGDGNKPGDVLQDRAAIKEASELNAAIRQILMP